MYLCVVGGYEGSMILLWISQMEKYKISSSMKGKQPLVIRSHDIRVANHHLHFNQKLLHVYISGELVYS